MKKALTLALFLGVVSSAASGQGLPTHPELREQLVSMMHEDQQFRDFGRIQSMPPGERNAFVAKGIEQDMVHASRLKQIIAEFGWPTESMVGEDGAAAAFLIVQHADRDPEFQAQMLPRLEDAARQGDLPWPQVAFLTDRVLMSQNRPQRYGTQYLPKRNADGTLALGDNRQPVMLLPVVEDLQQLDALRAGVGLEPWSQYEQRMAPMQGRSPAAVQPLSRTDYCQAPDRGEVDPLCTNATPGSSDAS